MQFASTRSPQQRISLSDALTEGLAPDGGLYVPSEWPHLEPASDPNELARLGCELLQPFAAGDALADEIAAITQEAFNFPAPLRLLDSARALHVLELFHGPTAAFKDFGARFLASALTRLRSMPARRPAPSRPLKILVATSGDTGGAVAAAFHRRAGIEVVVLFPRGLVSPTQERQLSCWDQNVRSFAVRGSFDDCQRLVKQAFGDARLRARFELSSANSINLGRLLPQMVYYWAASLALRLRDGRAVSFVVPSGNLGNATACVWARQLGAPIGTIVLAHNANRTVLDYLQSGQLRARASIATLSSAMDVGNPSNLERLTTLFGDAAAMRGGLCALSIDDAATRERIRADFERYGRIWCPHSAVAAEAYARLPPAMAARGPWVLVATAHPAKFREIIEPLIGQAIPMPASLARLFERPSRYSEIEASLDALEPQL